MNHLQRVAAIVGTILLGSSIFFLSRSKEGGSRGSRRRGEDPPVEELAEHLKEAWAGYHVR